jgi:glycosyltransferase involved in cell wall biosynthesis
MARVVYDHHAFSLQPFGGISRYFCELAARVNSAADMAAQVVAPLHYNHHLQSTGDLPTLGQFWRMRHPASWRLYRGTNAVVTPALLALTRPDLLHTTYYWGVPRWFRAPVVVTVFDMIHELYPDSFPANDATATAKRASVLRADHILAISHSTARDLIRLLGVSPAKISVTHLGFANTLVAAPLSHSKSARPYLLYVGQRHGYKNFRAMLQAWADSPLLRATFDLLAFGGGAFTPAEQAAIADIQPREGAVRQMGGGDAELAQAYRQARAFIYPSAYEGFGIPPLEAMSVGCPVVCSNTSSLPEVVGDAALTFDPTDREALRTAMERIVQDETLRADLASRGLVRVKQFTWDNCARETVSVYRQLID